jgi:hypothetical protein
MTAQSRLPRACRMKLASIWARSLDELELQMTRATFDTWLRGSQVVEAGDGLT